MPNGGYVLENGITLCDPTKTGGKPVNGCHYRAEERLKTEQVWKELGKPISSDDGIWPEYAPTALYEKVNSSYEKALEASEFLK